MFHRLRPADKIFTVQTEPCVEEGGGGQKVAPVPQWQEIPDRIGIKTFRLNKQHLCFHRGGGKRRPSEKYKVTSSRLQTRSGAHRVRIKIINETALF